MTRRLEGADALLTATIDGVTFHRSKQHAAALGVPRHYLVEWHQISTTALGDGPGGKPYLTLGVRPDHPDEQLYADPAYAVRVKRKRVREAEAFLELLADELAARRRGSTD